MEKLDNRETKREKYDIVFIGGGPSTLGFFSYLMKISLLEKFINNLNILIIEKSNSFGSGCLGKYGINSNTSAEGFIRLITHLSDDKSNKGAKYTLSPDKVKNNERKKRVMYPFDDLYSSQSCKLLMHIGSKIAPLPLIGNFLDSVGNNMVEYIHTLSRKNILSINSEVEEIYYNSHKDSGYKYEIKYKQKVGVYGSSDSYTIYSKALVLATGGRQRFDHNLKKEILKMIDNSDFFHSDHFLTEPGYLNFVNRCKERPGQRIVIIGGSHSGFSCAWMILNSPIRYNYLNDDKSTKYQAKTNRECNKCTKENCCYGAVNEKNWSIGFINTAKYKSLFNDAEIEIIYRDHIRVYYQSEHAALNDGYNVYDPKKAVNKNGNVYPFIGIRGDAKDLYRKIIQGGEKRVKLIKCQTFKEQKERISKANYVIWAAGYTTNNISIFEKATKKEIEFISDENKQIEVDKELKLMDSNKHTYNTLFGIGQGFSTHSIEILSNGNNARADSVNLYNTYVGKKLTKVLESIFFKDKLLDKKEHFNDSINNNKMRMTSLKKANSKQNLVTLINNKENAINYGKEYLKEKAKDREINVLSINIKDNRKPSRLVTGVSISSDNLISQINPINQLSNYNQTNQLTSSLNTISKPNYSAVNTLVHSTEIKNPIEYIKQKSITNTLKSINSYSKNLSTSNVLHSPPINKAASFSSKISLPITKKSKMKKLMDKLKIALMD